MSLNKKRKLNIGQGTQLLSAVALRRQFLEKQATAAVVAANEGTSEMDPEESRPGQSEISVTEKKARKSISKVASPLRTESRTQQKVVAETENSVVPGELPATLEPMDRLRKERTVQLSSFKQSKSNYQKKPDGTVLLKLPERERLVILGSYGIKVRSGEATIAGATLYPSETIHWVHAPHCHALPVLRCSDESVIELCSHPGASDLRSLERLSPVFGNLWHEIDTESPERRDQVQSFQIVSTSADGPKKALLQDLRSPAEWNKKLADLLSVKYKKPPIILVCGPKSSGKSTLSRILTNRLVIDQGRNKKRTWPGIAVLDLDPGQPEFSPPGTISLVRIHQPNLAPPFCHPTAGEQHIIRSHVVASVTPASDIEHYKECAFDLFTCYQRSCKRFPLVVNTPGWIQGSGLVLLTELIGRLHPTEVVYMSEDGPEDTVEGLKVACKKLSFNTLPSQASEYTSRTALHLRNMQTMSYFHMDPGASSGFDIRWTSSTLTSMPPLLVRYSGLNPGISGIMCYGYQPEKELLADAINGSVLAIVEIEDGKAFRDYSERGETEEENNPMEVEPESADEPITSQVYGLREKLIDRTPENIPYIRREITLDPRYSRSLGLVLVRGIDIQRGALALLTPMAPERLNEASKAGKAIVLVSGKFDPPTWAYTEDHYKRAFGSCWDDGAQDGPEVMDEDTDDDMSDDAQEELVPSTEHSQIPWTEKLHGNQKRVVGSRVWRVRRDLGRSGNATD